MYLNRIRYKINKSPEILAYKAVNDCFYEPYIILNFFYERSFT